MSTYEFIIGYKNVTRHYKDGVLHNQNGPATKSPCGYRAWWVNGRRHRTDGPAVEYSDGETEWYINGVRLSKKNIARQQLLLKRIGELNIVSNIAPPIHHTENWWDEPKMETEKQ